MATAAKNLTTIVGGPQSSNNGVTIYWAKERQMMAMDDVRITITDVQEKRNAGIGPSASKM